MLYRIDYQHFLTHAIDYFPTKALVYQFQYFIMSAEVTFNGRITNGAKAHPEMYPETDLIADYAVSHNYENFEKGYHAYLGRKPEGRAPVSSIEVALYRTFVETYLNHVDVMIVCDKEENFIIDALCSYLKKRYKIEVVDLNALFTKGEIGPISIDRPGTRDVAVDIRRAAADARFRELEATSEGRLKVLSMMTKKDKIKKLKELGINVTDTATKKLNALLMDAYVEDEEE